MLEKLRDKPNHIKKSIALALTIVIFSCILFVWLSSWDARSQSEQTLEKTVSPLAGFAAMFDGLASNVRESFSGVPLYIENTPSSATNTATTSSAFDVSGVVVIDTSASTTPSVR